MMHFYFHASACNVNFSLTVYKHYSDAEYQQYTCIASAPKSLQVSD